MPVQHPSKLSPGPLLHRQLPDVHAIDGGGVWREAGRGLDERVRGFYVSSAYMNDSCRLGPACHNSEELQVLDDFACRSSQSLKIAVLGGRWACTQTVSMYHNNYCKKVPQFNEAPSPRPQTTFGFVLRKARPQSSSGPCRTGG